MSNIGPLYDAGFVDGQKSMQLTIHKLRVLAREFASLAIRTEYDETPDAAIKEMIQLADDPDTRALLEQPNE